MVMKRYYLIVKHYSRDFTLNKQLKMLNKTYDWNEINSQISKRSVKELLL